LPSNSPDGDGAGLYPTQSFYLLALSCVAPPNLGSVFFYSLFFTAFQLN
jgi:hypothetical protein